MQTEASKATNANQYKPMQPMPGGRAEGRNQCQTGFFHLDIGHTGDYGLPLRVEAIFRSLLCLLCGVAPA